MKVQITNGMLMAIIINTVYAKAIGLTQGTMAREVGSDIWISTIIATLFSILIVFMIVVIIRRFPTGDMMDQSKILLGTWFSKIISLILFIFFLGAYGAIMITYVYHLMDYFLPEAPVYIFIIIAFIVGCYGAFFGIEVIGRMALIGVFSVLALNILLMLGSLSMFDIRELLPTFQSGVTNTVWASRHHVADWAMATMTLAVVLPYVRNPKEWSRSNIAAILFGGAFVVMWPILQVGVLSPEVTAQYIVSCMQMARSAEIGQFIHRYEMIMIAFFAISILTQIMMCFLCASTAVSKLFGLKDYRHMIIPTALVLSGYGFWVVFDHQRAMEILETTWVELSLSIAIGLPILLLVLGIFRKKKLKKANDQANQEAEKKQDGNQTQKTKKNQQINTNQKPNEANGN
ncbi:spore germination protein YndE [Lysinibacillus sp. PLM2]|nr:spore germination protein YndE [Lysinibacillus sp. PLM2]